MTGVSTVELYDQMWTVGDGSGRMGDCLRAAVATLLQIPPDRVPHFAESSDWLGALLAFRDGLHYFTLQKGYWPPHMETALPWVIGCGRSPRGVMHAVILSAADGSLIHDPHPSRDGLSEPPTAVIKTDALVPGDDHVTAGMEAVLDLRRAFAEMSAR